MTDPIRRYDPFWSHFDAAELKRLVVLWGGSNKLRKEECLHYLTAALKDTHLIDATLTRMHPHERAALGLLKIFGGTLDLHPLSIAVRMTGTVPMGERYVQKYGEDPVIQFLIERGIVMGETGSHYISSSYHYSSSGTPVFADDRILARIQPLEHMPLAVGPAEYPTTSTFRRAPSVVLDIISILRTVDDIGGIGLTKSGDMRVNDLRKFMRKMGWGDQIEIDGLTFPDPTLAYLSAMIAGGLLSENAYVIVGAASLEQIGARPTTAILRSLMDGMVGMGEWVEFEPSGYYRFQRNCTLGRLAVVTALRCLPDQRAWFRFAEFERALFDRIGEVFSVGDLKYRPRSYGKAAAEERLELAKWRQQIREDWEKIDVPWLQAVFRTWMYAFGLVELSLEGGVVERFRLTDAGRAVLWPDASEATAQPPSEQTLAWVVQPNFDVVVYLGSASTEQIAFLEQYAERIQVAQHTAQYRLTRDSVYEGLQRGTGVDRLLEGLAAGSRVALTGNVITEIRNWAALRERITVRRRAELIEFPDKASRQRAIASGASGVEVGERFLLLSGRYAESGMTATSPEIVNYELSAPRCLHVSEEGLITFSTARHDLLTLGYLNLWARGTGEDAWQLTRESVGSAIKRGRTLAELLTFLQHRLIQNMPGILLTALRAWAGEAIAAGMAEAVVLQCLQSEVVDALLASKALKPHLLGRVGPTSILVNRAGVEKVRAVLEWAGVQVSAKITHQKG